MVVLNSIQQQSPDSRPELSDNSIESIPKLTHEFSEPDPSAMHPCIRIPLILDLPSCSQNDAKPRALDPKLAQKKPLRFYTHGPACDRNVLRCTLCSMERMASLCHVETFGFRATKVQASGVSALAK